MIEDVVNGVREAFRDEGIDDAVLLELKENWETKVSASKVIDPVIYPAEASLQSKLQQSIFFSSHESCSIIMYQVLFTHQSRSTN